MLSSYKSCESCYHLNRCCSAPLSFESTTHLALACAFAWWLIYAISAPTQQLVGKKPLHTEQLGISEVLPPTPQKQQAWLRPNLRQRPTSL